MSERVAERWQLKEGKPVIDLRGEAFDMVADWRRANMKDRRWYDVPWTQVGMLFNTSGTMEADPDYDVDVSVEWDTIPLPVFAVIDNREKNKINASVIENELVFIKGHYAVDTEAYVLEEYGIIDYTADGELRSYKDLSGTKIAKHAERKVELLFNVFFGLVGMLEVVKNLEVREAEPRNRAERRRLALGGGLKKTILVLTNHRGAKYTPVSSFQAPQGHERFHHVRGHFAEYTEAAPLFGRLTGHFWIPPHMRGDLKVGRTLQTVKVS